MVRGIDELLDSIKLRIGEDVSDETLGLIEDVTDTFTDMQTRVTEAGDWKSKYEQNDKEWREKYRDRFFNKPANEEYQQEDEQEYEETETKLTFEDLFKPM